MLRAANRMIFLHEDGVQVPELRFENGTGYLMEACCDKRTAQIGQKARQGMLQFKTNFRGSNDTQWAELFVAPFTIHEHFTCDVADHRLHVSICIEQGLLLSKLG